MSDEKPSASTQAFLETAGLLNRIRSGESEAYTLLFDRYRPRLEIFMKARLPRAARSLMETQDVVQEVCIQLLPNLRDFEYRGIGSFWAYLRRAALNNIYSVWRRYSGKEKEEHLPQESWCVPSDPVGSPLVGILLQEQMHAFEHSIERLAEKRRHVLPRVEMRGNSLVRSAGFRFRGVSPERRPPVERNSALRS